MSWQFSLFIINSFPSLVYIEKHAQVALSMKQDERKWFYMLYADTWRRHWWPTPVPLPGKSHGRRSLDRLQSMGSQRVGHDRATSLSLFTFMHWRRKWQPTPVFLPGESQGWEPGGLLSMGSHRVGHNWRDLAAVAVACWHHVGFIINYAPCFLTEWNPGISYRKLLSIVYI